MTDFIVREKATFNKVFGLCQLIAQQHNTVSFRNKIRRAMHCASVPYATLCACFSSRKQEIKSLDTPITRSTMFLPFSRKFCFNKLEKISSTSKQVYYYYEKRRFPFKPWSVGLSAVKAFWNFSSLWQMQKW